MSAFPRAMALHEDLGWLLLVVVPLAGLAYGRFRQGWQNKARVLLGGLILSLGVALLVAVTGLLGEGFGTSVTTITVLGAVLTVLFVAGVWGGDALENRARRKRGEEPLEPAA